MVHSLIYTQLGDDIRSWDIREHGLHIWNRRADKAKAKGNKRPVKLGYEANTTAVSASREGRLFILYPPGPGDMPQVFLGPFAPR